MRLPQVNFQIILFNISRITKISILSIAQVKFLKIFPKYLQPTNFCLQLFCVGTDADADTLTFALGALSVAGHPFAITNPQETIAAGATHDSTLTLAGGFLDFDTDTSTSYVLEIE